MRETWPRPETAQEKPLELGVHFCTSRSKWNSVRLGRCQFSKSIWCDYDCLLRLHKDNKRIYFNIILLQFSEHTLKINLACRSRRLSFIGHDVENTREIRARGKERERIPRACHLSLKRLLHGLKQAIHCLQILLFIYLFTYCKFCTKITKNITKYFKPAEMSVHFTYSKANCYYILQRITNKKK